MSTKSHDPRLPALLADHFLYEGAHTEEQAADLAQAIQDAVEDWFSREEDLRAAVLAGEGEGT